MSSSRSVLGEVGQHSVVGLEITSWPQELTG